MAPAIPTRRRILWVETFEAIQFPPAESSFYKGLRAIPGRIAQYRSSPRPVSTSYAERSNLTIRMHTRRFTRLTNAFSKKVENHAQAVALHMMYYNFVRIHKTLKTTPAMAAKVTDRLWEVADMVNVLEAWEAI